MSTHNNLPERLKQCREDSELKQKEVAAILGVHFTTYNKYETGDRKPSPETLVKLANIFRVPVNYLISGKVPDGIVEGQMYIDLLTMETKEQDTLKEIQAWQVAHDAALKHLALLVEKQDVETLIATTKLDSDEFRILVKLTQNLDLYYFVEDVLKLGLSSRDKERMIDLLEDRYFRTH